jgi:hypothetical protein
LLIEVIVLTVIILLYPLGFLSGYARGRRVKVLTAISDLLGGNDGDPGEETA